MKQAYPGRDPYFPLSARFERLKWGLPEKFVDVFPFEGENEPAPPRRRERGGRHIKLAHELALAFREGRVSEADLGVEEARYVEWSRRMHARIWRAA